PVQVVSPTGAVKLEIIDLENEPESVREGLAAKLAQDDARLPFDLSTGPLMRLKLVRLNETDHVLIVTAHHIVSDGWSIGVLIQELATLYEAFSRNKPSPLPELPIQYADFACHQRESLDRASLDEQLSYWRNKLGGHIPALDLPFANPRGEAESFNGSR